jgi:hypothetical protein
MAFILWPIVMEKCDTECTVARSMPPSAASADAAGVPAFLSVALKPPLALTLRLDLDEVSAARSMPKMIIFTEASQKARKR